ncbi:MAG: bifunctional diguanylate cyclase/phosphodiesterase [Cellvibrio sp.]|uniref:putative bifunctional diguanylate cyclase/phosphodiesterase n=1 Tax=Cellvibrio sp. TaxID=1965322 RepID=UPI0031A392B7
MAIGNDLKLIEMLRIFMRVSMSRLDLSSVHVFLFCDSAGVPTFADFSGKSLVVKHCLSIPRQYLGAPWAECLMLQTMVAQHLESKSLSSTVALNNKTYHCFSLPAHGVIVFEGIYELDPVIQKSLDPIFKKLSLSCYACIAHESLLKEMAARHLAEKTIAHQAAHDELTQLANRRKLTERLEESLVHCRHYQKYGALLFIDLNQFKSINDVMGHDVGDKILQEVAQRLLSITRSKDTVARFGGDEFVILLPDLGRNREEAELIVCGTAARIHDAVEVTFDLTGVGYNISCSMGYEIFPNLDESYSDIIKNADLAMYEAKAMRQRVALAYHPDMSEKHNTRLAYASDLKAAIKNNEFELYYQPQFNRAHEIIGAEALLRWHNPKYQFESPAVYIPIAEDSDLILDIGDWVLNEACKHLKVLQAQGLLEGFKKLSINVSGKQLTQQDFFARICQALAVTDAPPQNLAIEITENVLVSGINQAMTLMSDLQAIGVECSIDDFGTGYSSLAYLKRFPAHMIKIDRSFVRDIHSDAESRSIARMIIALGNNLDMEILAEGVESREELACLQELGCQQYQGYYFSRPVPFTNLLAMLHQPQVEEVE